MPALLRLTGKDVEQQENRIKAKAPVFSTEVLLKQNYYDDFNKYFNDNFSMRGYYIFAKNWIDFNAFSTSPSYNNVHIGKKGWLYYLPEMKDFFGEACDEEASVDRLVLQLHALESVLRASGKTFYFMVAPNKSTIYPEFVGYTPGKNNCDKSKLNIVLDRFSVNPLNGFIRLDEQLMKEKAGNPSVLLYYKTDTHWNWHGAKIASEMILERVSSDVSDNVSHKHFQPSVEFHETSYVGDLVKLLGLENIVELADRVNFPNPSATSEKKAYLLSNGLYIEHFTLDRTVGVPSLPSAVFYGDSFLDRITDYVKGAFSKIDVIPSQHTIPTKEDIEDLSSYRIVLFEVVERELNHVIININKVVSALRSSIHPSRIHSLNLQTIKTNPYAYLQFNRAGVAVISDTHMPEIMIPSVPASNNTTFKLIKLSIESPKSEGEIQIYFNSNENARQHERLRVGLQDIYFILPYGDKVSAFIKLNKTHGAFNLHGIKILEFDSKMKLSHYSSVMSRANL